MPEGIAAAATGGSRIRVNYNTNRFSVCFPPSGARAFGKVTVVPPGRSSLIDYFRIRKYVRRRRTDPYAGRLKNELNICDIGFAKKKTQQIVRDYRGIAVGNGGF